MPPYRKPQYGLQRNHEMGLPAVSRNFFERNFGKSYVGVDRGGLEDRRWVSEGRLTG